MPDHKFRGGFTSVFVRFGHKRGVRRYNSFAIFPATDTVSHEERKQVCC